MYIFLRLWLNNYFFFQFFLPNTSHCNLQYKPLCSNWCFIFITHIHTHTQSHTDFQLLALYNVICVSIFRVNNLVLNNQLLLFSLVKNISLPFSLFHGWLKFLSVCEKVCVCAMLKPHGFSFMNISIFISHISVHKICEVPQKLEEVMGDQEVELQRVITYWVLLGPMEEYYFSLSLYHVSRLPNNF